VNRNVPLTRRTALKQTSTLRRGETQLKRSRPRPRTQAERDAAAAWAVAVKSSGFCAACGKPADARNPLDAHHVLPQGLLERLEDERGLERGTLLWDVRIGIPLHGILSADHRCHGRHELAVKRVPLAKLPAVTYAFARSLGPQAERELRLYPGPPPAAPRAVAAVHEDDLPF
jgi:hypothetical protein